MSDKGGRINRRNRPKERETATRDTENADTDAATMKTVKPPPNTTG